MWSRNPRLLDREGERGMALTTRRSVSFLVVVGLVAGLFAVSALPASAAKGKKPATAPSLVDVAIAVNTEGPYAGAFDTLIAAVLAADPAVVQTLSSKGQYTVFAPTDDAFAAIGLNPTNIGSVPKDALTNILLYHVANGRRYADDVVASDQIRMLNAGVVFQEGGVLTDAQGRMSNIIVTDVEASNGVIHAIDGVLLP
jgi:uncharacterized surface protein with fasciclin (FAS1) repeats